MRGIDKAVEGAGGPGVGGAGMPSVVGGAGVISNTVHLPLPVPSPLPWPLAAGTRAGVRGIAGGGVTGIIGAGVRGIAGGGVTPIIVAFGFGSGFGVASAFALTAFAFSFGSGFGVAIVFAAFARRSADSDAGRVMVTRLQREVFSRGP